MRTFASLAELKAAGAEAVAISTPADTHTTLSEQALELGLAVVCDKPFALDAPSARGTVELAERLGLPLAPYQNRRWDSDFLTVRALAADGSLGEIVRFESRFERLDPEAGPEPPAAARCSTSALTSWTRRSSCSGRWPPSTRSGGCGRAAWTTTCSWP